MKIAVSAAELAGALALAALALDSRIKIEILHAVHIKAADGIAHLTVNGPDRIIAVSVKTEVAEPGETVVRAAALAGLAAGFKDGTIGIEADAHGAKIRCGRAIYRLAGHAAGASAGDADDRHGDGRGRARARGSAWGDQAGDVCRLDGGDAVLP